MTELLFIVGIAVFFLTVYGVVIVGGYLLKSQQMAAPVRVDAVTPAARRGMAPPAAAGDAMR
jgi:hypothetical protein